jgi:AcrR family transcriptional regulator
VDGAVATSDEPDGRRERSRRTRAGVVSVATGLFVDRGYLATTIEAVAQQAGVAPQTVYHAFGTKRNLLAAVLDASIAGDVDPVPVLERPWFGTLETDEDAVSAVERLVSASVAIVARAAPVYEVIRRAAADPEVGVLLDDNRRRRRDDQRRLIEILWRAGHLRPDIDVESAADAFYGLMNEEVYQLLTTDCGWDVERFQRWSTSLMLHELVGSRDRA